MDKTTAEAKKLLEENGWMKTEWDDSGWVSPHNGKVYSWDKAVEIEVKQYVENNQ